MDQQFTYNLNVTGQQLVEKMIASLNQVDSLTIKMVHSMKQQELTSGAVKQTFHALSSEGKAYSVTLKQLADGQVEVVKSAELAASTAKKWRAELAADAEAYRVEANAAKQKAQDELAAIAEAERLINVSKMKQAAMLGVKTGTQAANMAASQYTGTLSTQLGMERTLVIEQQKRLGAMQAAHSVELANAAAAKMRIAAFEQELAQLNRLRAARTSANVPVDQSIRQLTGAYRSLTNTAKENTQQMTMSWQSIMRLVQVQILHRIFASLSRYIREATQEAMRFGIAIASIQTISLQSEASVQQWQTQLKLLNTEFGSPMLQLAEAAYLGLSNQIMQSINDMTFLRENVRLATVAIGTMEQAVNATTSVVNAFDMAMYDTSHISAVLFKTIEMGRIRLEEMSEALGRVSMLSSQLGVTFEEQQTAFAVLTIQGVKFNVAQTLLSNVMLKLIKPSERMLELMSKYGVASGEAAIATYGFAGWLNILTKEAQGASDTMEEFGEMWGRLRAMTGAAGLMFNMDTFENTMKEMERGATDFDAALAKIMENPAKKLEIELEKIKAMFQVEWGNFMIGWGNSLSSAFGGLDNLIRKIVGTFRNLIITYAVMKLAINPLTAAFVKHSLAIKTVIWNNKEYYLSLSTLKRGLWQTQMAVQGLAKSFMTLAPFLAVTAIMYVVDAWGKARRELEAYNASLDQARMVHQQALDEITSANARMSTNTYRAEMQKLMQLVAFFKKGIVESQDELRDSVSDSLTSVTDGYKAYADRATAELKRIEESHKKLAKTIEDQQKTVDELERERLAETLSADELAAKAAQARKQAAATMDQDAAAGLIKEAETWEKALDKKIKEAEARSEKLDAVRERNRRLLEPTGREVAGQRIPGIRPDYRRPGLITHAPMEYREGQESALRRQEAEEEVRRLQALRRRHNEEIKRANKEREDALRREIPLNRIREEYEAQMVELQKEHKNVISDIGNIKEKDLQDDPQEALKQITLLYERAAKLQEELQIIVEAGAHDGKIAQDYVQQALELEKQLQLDKLAAMEAQTSELIKQQEAADKISQLQKDLRDHEERRRTLLDTATAAQSNMFKDLGRGVDMAQKYVKSITGDKDKRIVEYYKAHNRMTGKYTGTEEQKQAAIVAATEIKELQDAVARMVELDAKGNDITRAELQEAMRLQLKVAEIIQRQRNEGNVLRTELEGDDEMFRTWQALAKTVESNLGAYDQATRTIGETDRALAGLTREVNLLQQRYKDEWTESQRQQQAEERRTGLLEDQVEILGRVNRALAGFEAGLNNRVPHAKGGLVHGPSGIDRVPAMLTAGEYVWDVATTRKFMPLIKSLHENKVAKTSPLTNNYGNINVTIHGADSPQLTARAVIKEMKRELRRGTV